MHCGYPSAQCGAVGSDTVIRRIHLGLQRSDCHPRRASPTSGSYGGVGDSSFALQVFGYISILVGVRCVAVESKVQVFPDFFNNPPELIEYTGGHIIS